MRTVNSHARAHSRPKQRATPAAFASWRRNIGIRIRGTGLRIPRDARVRTRSRTGPTRRSLRDPEARATRFGAALGMIGRGSTAGAPMTMYAGTAVGVLVAVVALVGAVLGRRRRREYRRQSA